MVKRRTENTMVKRKKTNNNLQNTITLHRKLKIEHHETHEESEVNSCAPEV